MRLCTALIIALVGAGAGCLGESRLELDTEQPLPNSCTEGPPPPTPTRLLTREEYNNTLRDLLGDTTRPASVFPQEPRALGFENNAATHRVNPLLVRLYLNAAEDVAARAVRERRARLVPCDEATIGIEACADAFLAAFVRRAYRRAPTGEELSALETFFHAVLAQRDFDTAIEWTVQVVLQSPQFLYRIEPGVPNGDAAFPLSGEEIASRLSYFLWSTMPDDALLEAASRGELSTAAGVERHARRMLDDPKAHDAVASFFRQWLELEDVERAEKDPLAHPGFSSAVSASWRRSLELFTQQVVFGEGTLEALLSSTSLHVDAHLAPLYGLPAPEGPGFHRVDGAPWRRGLLTQPGLLAALSGPLESSPVRRGVFVREKLLCQDLPPPPPNVPLLPPDPDPEATTRERFAEHTANPACAGCHQLIDPVGFGFERYDALGRYRERDNGQPVSAQGELTGVDDPAIAGTFDGALELSGRLAQSPLVHQCMVTHWFRFAVSRAEGAEDECELARVRHRFWRTGGNFKELLVAIVRSEAFRYRAAPAVVAP